MKQYELRTRESYGSSLSEDERTALRSSLIEHMNRTPIQSADAYVSDSRTSTSTITLLVLTLLCGAILAFLVVQSQPESFLYPIKTYISSLLY